MNKTTGIAIALGVLLLGAAAYLMFRPGSDPTLTANAPTSEAELRFISLTAKIDPVHLDSAVLDDARFIGLQDIRTAIIPEPQGRTDPFAPLAGVK